MALWRYCYWYFDITLFSLSFTLAFRHYYFSLYYYYIEIDASASDVFWFTLIFCRRHAARRHWCHDADAADAISCHYLPLFDCWFYYLLPPPLLITLRSMYWYLCWWWWLFSISFRFLWCFIFIFAIFLSIIDAMLMIISPCRFIISLFPFWCLRWFLHLPPLFSLRFRFSFIFFWLLSFSLIIGDSAEYYAIIEIIIVYYYCHWCHFIYYFSSIDYFHIYFIYTYWSILFVSLAAILPLFVSHYFFLSPLAVRFRYWLCSFTI